MPASKTLTQYKPLHRIQRHIYFMLAEPITAIDKQAPMPLQQPDQRGANSEVVISVRDVGKMYRIYDRPQDRLKQMILRGRRMYGR